MSLISIAIILVVISATLIVMYLKFDTIFKKNKSKKRKRTSSEYSSTKQIDSLFLSKNTTVKYNVHFFSDKKIAITGVFKKFATRNDLAKLLWEHGAIIDTKFNSNTDYLIVGTLAFDSLKIKSAFYLNIKVITEDELLKYFTNLELNNSSLEFS